LIAGKAFVDRHRNTVSGSDGQRSKYARKGISMPAAPGGSLISPPTRRLGWTTRHASLTRPARARSTFCATTLLMPPGGRVTTHSAGRPPDFALLLRHVAAAMLAMANPDSVSTVSPAGKYDAGRAPKARRMEQPSRSMFARDENVPRPLSPVAATKRRLFGIGYRTDAAG